MYIDNVDKYMYETEKAIRKHVKNPDAFTEIYNRAYEAVAYAIRDVCEENHPQDDISTIQGILINSKTSLPVKSDELRNLFK